MVIFIVMLVSYQRVLSLAKKATSEGKLAPLMTNSRSLPTVQILGAWTHDSVDRALEAKLRVPFQATIRSTEQIWTRLQAAPSKWWEVLNGLDLLWSTSIARIQKIDTISTLEKGMVCLVNMKDLRFPSMPYAAFKALKTLNPQIHKPSASLSFVPAHHMMNLWRFQNSHRLTWSFQNVRRFVQVWSPDESWSQSWRCRC